MNLELIKQSLTLSLESEESNCEEYVSDGGDFNHHNYSVHAQCMIECGGCVEYNNKSFTNLEVLEAEFVKVSQQ